MPCGKLKLHLRCEAFYCGRAITPQWIWYPTTSVSGFPTNLLLVTVCTTTTNSAITPQAEKDRQLFAAFFFLLAAFFFPLLAGASLVLGSACSALHVFQSDCNSLTFSG